jgi:hypothetical protein
MFSNAVNIPLNLAMNGFNAGIAAATSGINILARQIVGVSAVSARAIGAIAVGATPVLQAVGTGIVSAFSVANIAKIRAINDATQMFVANLLLSATNLQQLGVLTYLSATIDPALRALVVTATGLDAAIVNLVLKSVTGFNKLGVAAKVNVAGLALGAFVALSSAIPVVGNQITLANRIFVTGLIPNVQTLNALILETKSFFKSSLLTPARYADFPILAGIVRNLLPQTSLLGQTLNAIAVPAKFLSNLQASLGYFRLMKQEITLFANEINNLSVGLIQSAGVLASGQGFLMPGQIPAGPTALNMFSDKQQAVQEAVQFDQLTRNFEAVAKWSGAAGSAIDGVKREILQLQGATGQTSDKTAEMAAILQRSGQPIEHAASQLKVFANAASATNGDIIVLGSTILDLLDSFGMGAEETDRVTNALTAVSLKTGTTIEMLSRSLKVSGVIAKESNQSFEETLIAIGLLSSGGIEANLAGNALVDMLTNLKVASNEITNLDFSSLQTASTKGKALAALGLTKEDISTAQGELKPLTEIIPNLQAKVAAFKAASGAGATTTLLTSIFGQEDLKAVTTLLATTPSQINNLTSAISNSGGVAQKITGSQMSNLSGTLERLNGAAIGISTTLGQMLSPILNAVLFRITTLIEGFLKLPSAIQAVAFSLSITVPVLLFYFKATKTVLYFNRLLEVSKVALGVALDIYTGKLAISTVITNISNEATKVKLFFTNALTFATSVLTGKISLQTAQQIILNAATKFGNANYKEYIGTTLQAGKILLKNIATLGLMIVAWQALSELFKQSPGAKIAGDIDKATQELSKLRGELEWQKNAPEIITDLQTSFTNFADNLQSKGFAEALRIQLTLVQDALIDSKSVVDAYGQGWIVTGEQLGNQKSMFALERQLQSVHSVLDDGITIMQKYGVETLDAADKQRLGVGGISAFKAASEEQIKILNAGVEVMRKQAPATEEQKQLQQSNIKLAERQINTLRTKVQALESDTFAEQINNKAMQAKILTLDEVSKKYKELANLNELMSLKSTASIEEMLAKGEGRGGINQKEATIQQRGLEKIGITQRVQSNTSQIKDLKAASIGATPEDAAKINDELKRLEVDQIKARIDAAKLEQEARKNINEEILANTKEREDFLVAKQELSSQSQITAIKKAQAARTYSAEEAATKIAAIETADLQASIARETEKQQKLKQLRQWGVISEEDMRKGLRDSQSAIAKTQTQLAEGELKKSEERMASQVRAIEERANSAKMKAEGNLGKLDARSFAGDQQGKITTAQSGVGDARSELDKQRLGFALQFAELNNNQAQQEQIKGQIYQQQLSSLTAQQQAKRQELVLSQQQQAIELERKRIQSELAVIEAQSALQVAQTKGASAAELAGLQQSIALKQQIVAQVVTEQANQGKLNSLSSQQLAIQQQTTKEGLQQQRQIDLERQAIEKKTKAIEDGLNRARALSEARSQTLEFKGQDIGAEISKQKLLADISQSQSNLQKQRLEFSLQLAELSGNESNKEQLKQQIYQQQQASLIAQQQAQRTSLELSNQQAAIELERKRIGAEIALLEAQANLQSAEAKNASASEIAGLQAVLGLRQKSVAYISTEEANQNKINQLTGQHLNIEQRIAREGLQQQRQLELQKLAIEKRTKAIEDGLIRSRTALEGQSQKLEFKGQGVGGEIEKQKGVTDLQQSQAALQKQQLDFALQRAELTGNESAKEQIKEQIYRQQKAALVAQQQAQVVGIGLSRQQAAIELERQKLSAQIALTEAQANLAKAQVTKGSSVAELESLRAAIGYRQQALGQITAQAAVSKSVQSTEDQKLAIERQTTMENLVQTRELERQKEAIEKQKQAIEERLQAQKSGLENRQGKLELSNQLLDLESRQLSARSGLTEAVNGLEQQRLEFLMSQAEITGNTAQKESLKTQLYQQQLAALDRSQQAQQQSFEISQKQKQIELDRQEIQAKIATFEAEANIAKAKADNNSAQQITALEAVYKLRQEALSQMGQMQTAEGQIASLERQKLTVEQLSAREKLRQTNQLEKMRAAHEANNQAIKKSTQLEKEKSAAQQTSIDTSGGLSWVDKAGPAWFEGAKTSFQQAADDYLAATIPPDLTVAPLASGTVPGLAPSTSATGKTPDTPQQFANMQISAQNVYINGAIAESQKPAGDWISKTLADNAPIAQTQPMDATAQREAAKAKIEQAQSALSTAIARHNTEARALTIDPAEAARQGLAAAASARDFAAQIRADLKSGVLKNQTNGQIMPLNLPPTLAELASNLANAQAALKEVKDPVTVESIYKMMGEIKEILTKQSIGNLTVVSQNPVAECGEILNALTRRR